MMGDVVRLYEHGRFSNIPLPVWFRRAVDIRALGAASAAVTSLIERARSVY